MRWLVLCVLLSGCDFMFVQPADSKRDVKKPVAETIFTVLAEHASTDVEFYSTTDDLRRVVNRLLSDRRISQEQADAVTRVLGTSRRPLTSADIDAIRGL